FFFQNYIEYGTNVNIAQYENQRRQTFNGVGKVYPYNVQDSLQSGYSVQFTNPQSYCDTVWYYCDLLQEVFGCFVGANTYITPANKAGFAPHWDDIDAFLLQLEGRKHWKLYAPPDEDGMLPRISSDNFTDEDVVGLSLIFDDWLEQGDLLYIPRGFIHQVLRKIFLVVIGKSSVACHWHRARDLIRLMDQGFTDKTVHSLHLTVSVCRKVTYADLLERFIPPAITSFAEQKRKMRESLPVGYVEMASVLGSQYPISKSAITKYGLLICTALRLLFLIVFLFLCVFCSYAMWKKHFDERSSVCVCVCAARLYRFFISRPTKTTGLKLWGLDLRTRAGPTPKMGGLTRVVLT
ncbi:unnamed protein product, partial [Gongylonema pulchrum]|uniref:Bifunctional lysine-specific demethylase and histidyl-hydroxylase n=1 Tax=Gongylonema pulchrum TaxID=637853 RepID=A0A183D3W2_9BILA